MLQIFLIITFIKDYNKKKYYIHNLQTRINYPTQMDYPQDKPSNRQPFQIQQPSQNRQSDQGQGQYITVDKPHVAMTIWNLIITGTCIGLFAYVNSYFVITLHNVANNTVIKQVTQTFSCDQYFCDRTLYNYMNYYSFYQQCNDKICTQLICSTYAPECNATTYWPDLNRYFACRPSCAGYLKSDYPDVIFVGYSLGVAAAVCFGLFLLTSILMGIVFNILAKQINSKERIALLIGFLWPSLKYYMFRKRVYWGEFDLNLKAVIIVDYISAFFITITTAIYIWFYYVGAWFDAREISLFFILLGTFLSHWLMCWANSRAFWKAKQRFS